MYWNPTLWNIISEDLRPNLVQILDEINESFDRKEHLLFKGGSPSDVFACLCWAVDSRHWILSTPSEQEQPLLGDDSRVFLIRNPEQFAFAMDYCEKYPTYAYTCIAIHATGQYSVEDYKPTLDRLQYRTLELIPGKYAPAPVDQENRREQTHPYYGY